MECLAYWRVWLLQVFGSVAPSIDMSEGEGLIKVILLLLVSCWVRFYFCLRQAHSALTH